MAQSAVKFGEHKSFGEVDPCRASQDVRLLGVNGFGRNDKFVGADVKAMLRGISNENHRY
jgi:hypothetical protein